MGSEEKYIEDEMTLEEFELYKEKFCQGVFKVTILAEAEVEQLKIEGRI